MTDKIAVEYFRVHDDVGGVVSERYKSIESYTHMCMRFIATAGTLASRFGAQSVNLEKSGDSYHIAGFNYEKKPPNDMTLTLAHGYMPRAGFPAKTAPSLMLFGPCIGLDESWRYARMNLDRKENDGIDVPHQRIIVAIPKDRVFKTVTGGIHPIPDMYPVSLAEAKGWAKSGRFTEVNLQMIDQLSDRDWMPYPLVSNIIFTPSNEANEYMKKAYQASSGFSPSAQDGLSSTVQERDNWFHRFSRRFPIFSNSK